MADPKEKSSHDVHVQSASRETSARHFCGVAGFVGLLAPSATGEG